MKASNMKASIVTGLMLWITFNVIPSIAHAQESMDKLWGDRVVKLRAENAERGQLFDEDIPSASLKAIHFEPME